MERKNKIFVFLIIFLIIFIVSMFIYNKEDGSEKDKIDDTEEKYILKTKTALSTLCPQNDCASNLGIVKIENKEYELNVNLKNINSYETSGTISLGDNTIDVRKMDLIEDKYIYSNIEGFEIYKEYFIVYLRSKDETNGNYHGYSIQIYNANLEKVSGLDGYTCGTFREFEIKNDDLYYNAVTALDKPDIYDATLNINNYKEISVNKKISMDDLLKRNYDKSQLLSVNYTCGGYSN